MKPLRAYALSLALMVVLAGVTPAFSCDAAGPSTHLGVVTAVDTVQKTFTLKDAQTGKPLTFVASAEMLQGIKVKDEVAVVYAAEGKNLRATAVKKS